MSLACCYHGRIKHRDMQLINASRLFYYQLPLIERAQIAKYQIESALRLGERIYGLDERLRELNVQYRGRHDPLQYVFEDLERYRYVLVHSHSQPPMSPFLPLAGMTEHELQSLKPEDVKGAAQQDFLRFNRFQSSPSLTRVNLAQAQATQQSQDEAQNTPQASTQQQSTHVASAGAGTGTSNAPQAPVVQNQEQIEDRHWLALKYQNPQHQPLAGESYTVTLADGSEIKGVLDDKGEARVDNIPAGKTKVTLGEAPPQLDTLRSEIQKTLGAIVTEREAEAARIDKELERMSALQSTAEHGVSLATGFYHGAAGLVSFIGTVVSKTVEAAYYISPLNDMTNLLQGGWKAYQDGQLSEDDWYQHVAKNFQQEEYADLVSLLGFDPKDIDPQAFTQAFEITSFILDDEPTQEIIWEFIKDYTDATTSTQWAEIAGGAVFEIVLTALLLVFTAGAGNLAQIASKVKHADKLKALGEQLQQLGKLLRRKKLSKTIDAETNRQVVETEVLPRGTAINASPEVKPVLGKAISMDGHKIYDPAFPPLSTNPGALYRYSDPDFRKTGGDVYLGENVVTSYQEVRRNSNGKSVFMGEVQIDNILDLTDPKVLQTLDVDRERIVTLVNSDDEIAEVYSYTNKIANQAYADGYKGILYPSSRNKDAKAIVLFHGRYDESNIRKILDFSLEKGK